MSSKNQFKQRDTLINGYREKLCVTTIMMNILQTCDINFKIACMSEKLMQNYHTVVFMELITGANVYKDIIYRNTVFRNWKETNDSLQMNYF